MTKFILALSLIGMATATAIAQPMPPPPELILAPPPGTELPPPPEPPPEDPEEAKMMLFADLFALMDTDGDGKISREEMMAWVMGIHFPGDGEPGDERIGAGHPPHPLSTESRLLDPRLPRHRKGHERMGHEGMGGGISEGDEGLEGLAYPEECSDATVTSEMSPQDTNVACAGSESEGNLVHRTVCNMAPYDSQAISLPEGRAADCFAIAAIKGHNIVFEIIKESDGAQMFHTSMGKTAYDTLVLIGEPGGAVYRIKLLSADETDARITLEFIDHPQF
jgi:hypothetical protein